MEHYLSFLPQLMSSQNAAAEMMNCNQFTQSYGLLLTEADAKQIIAVRKQVLASCGRVELGAGMLGKLIIAFCDSPYINQSDYTDILEELLEIFYYFKNESLDELSDDELIASMKQYFDHQCHGSLELLRSRELEILTNNIRHGKEEYEDLDLEEELYLGEDEE